MATLVEAFRAFDPIVLAGTLIVLALTWVAAASVHRRCRDAGMRGRAWTTGVALATVLTAGLGLLPALLAFEWRHRRATAMPA